MPEAKTITHHLHKIDMLYYIVVDSLNNLKKLQNKTMMNKKHSH